MKKLTFLIIIFALLNTVLFAQGKAEVLYVNSKYGTCETMPYGTCYQIKDAKSRVYKDWQNYPGEIRGFKYKEGFIYTITVKKIMHEVAPSEGVNFYYKLIKVIGKKAVKKTIEPKIVLAKISKEKYFIVDYLDSIGMKRVSQKKSFIQFDIIKNKMWGNDGCNSFFGSIKSYTKDTIKFGPIAGTLMACMGLNNSDYKIRSLLERVTAYRIPIKDALELLEGDKVLLRLSTNFEGVPKLDGESIQKD